MRYIAMHKSEPGYETPEDVQRYIDRQTNPEDWIVASVTFSKEDWPEVKDFILYNRKREMQAAANRAVMVERRRIAKILGLGELP